MGRNRKLLVPEARSSLNQLKEQVMRQQGFQADHRNIKFEIANELGIPLDKGYNGNIRAKQAGQIGGQIGGSMVKEMVRMAEKQLLNKPTNGNLP